MHLATAILAAFLASASALPAAADLPPEATEGVPGSPSLPKSLDSFYPPAAGAPVYLIGMGDLETWFSGIAADLMEDDLDGARGSFGEFRKTYGEVAGMVPEWTSRYPEIPVENLGAALSAGDKGLAMKAIAEVGEICHRCHAEAMVPVQQRFHWGDFGALTVRDPLSGAEVGYTQFKKFLASSLAGIVVDLGQGQTDNARNQFRDFRARFEALRGSCGDCHDREPGRRFVDREARAALDAMGKAFESRTVSADAVRALAQRIGRESCSKCHRVHVPAALAGASRR